MEKSKGNINEVLSITSLTVSNDRIPQYITLFNDNNKYFYSLNEYNQWICFDFKEYKIIPTNYTIKSDYSTCNLKSWFIEGSNDNMNWEILDEQ